MSAQYAATARARPDALIKSCREQVSGHSGHGIRWDMVCTGLRRNEDGLQAIIKSMDFKKRQLAILEAEHSNKIEIQKLKIRKLQLEIALLQ
ncbi:hypothetical protein B5X24_HaOG205922 [Helicoverpa armigera]|uniref:Uncharacterized protein n=1 Tax=Helicoverpa armigera TaxID=29058 RepID=A0A2W1BSI6_HELAM|nr:hypothetical protein B5X24_HaOG205922 [Helicoverpa armigera]